MAVVSRGIAVPCFREDPAELIELDVEAERAGFDGFFLWDHLVWCRRGQDHAVALCDPAGHSRPLACGRMADLWRARRQTRRPQRRAGVGRRSGDRPDEPMAQRRTGFARRAWRSLGQQESHSYAALLPAAKVRLCRPAGHLFGHGGVRSHGRGACGIGGGGSATRYGRPHIEQATLSPSEVRSVISWQ